MTDQLWPDEAREAVATALAERMSNYDIAWTAEDYYPEADAVLAALSVHAVPRAAVIDLAQQWENPLASNESYFPVAADELRALAGGDQ